MRILFEFLNVTTLPSVLHDANETQQSNVFYSARRGLGIIYAEHMEIRRGGAGRRLRPRNLLRGFTESRAWF